jgi:hypothetical protein
MGKAASFLITGGMLMKKTMNEIIQVKYVEEFFSPEIMAVLDTWHVEFNQDGIVSYHKKYKSRKREDVVKVAVSYKEMKSFFWNYISLLDRQIIIQKL